MTRAKRKTPIPEADLDEAARIIWGGYLDFLLGGPPLGEDSDPKAFAGRHAAGKAALSHLEQLLKVAGSPGEDETAEAAGGHLGSARAGLAPFEGEEADTDGDGDG